MKIIHCADVHLDSRLSANLDRYRAEERREEILSTFLRLVKYAGAKAVRAILIAGDLFDTETVSPSVRRSVYEVICTNPGIDFYYLRGNHDTSGFFHKLDRMPENLKVFSDSWVTYEYPAAEGKKIVIAGAELYGGNKEELYSSLTLQEENFNIVTLHGELSDYRQDGKAEVIEIEHLSDKNIDYLALGHIHSQRAGKLPPRGIYSYSGCLEGRGFDECGKHGFVVLDINEEDLTSTKTFVNFSKRRHFKVEFDVTKFEYQEDIFKGIEEELEKLGCRHEDLIKVILKGEVGVEREIGGRLIEKRYEDDYYFFKVEDQTKLKVDYKDYLNDASLKGEFVRLLEACEPEEEKRAEIIRCGLRLLRGEEIDA